MLQHLKLCFLAGGVNHDKNVLLTVLFSVLALSLSLIERTPQSMGEDTESIKEGGAAAASVQHDSVIELGTESKTRETADSCTMSVIVSVVDSGVEGLTMSVTGRTAGGAVVLAASVTGGVEESAEVIWPESIGGGGVDDGETVSGLGELE